MAITPITETITPLDVVKEYSTDYFINISQRNNALVNTVFPEQNTLATQMNTLAGELNTIGDIVVAKEALIAPHYDAIDNAAANATSAQLSKWIAEAEAMTADSYASEPKDVFVKEYTSNGDGTFTSTPTTKYSVLHWSETLVDSNLVHKTDNETIAGIKTFSSTISGSINGNAATATKLATARTINGVPFDGTADVTLALATKPVIISKVNQTTVLVDGVSVVLSGGVAGKDYYIHKVGSTLSITDTKSADTIGGFHYSLVPHDEAPTGNKTEADMVKLRGINAYSIWTLWDMPLSGDARGKAKVGSSWYDIYLMDRDYGIRGYSAPTVHTGANIAAGAVDNARQIPKIPLAYGGNGTVTYGKFTWFQAGEIAVATKNRKISYNEFGGIAYGVVEGVDSAAYGDNGTIFHIPQLMSKYGIEQATGTEWIWGADLANGYGTTTFAWLNNADSRGQSYATSNAPVAVVLGGARADGVKAGSRASSWYLSVWASSWSVASRFACDSLEHA